MIVKKRRCAIHATLPITCFIVPIVGFTELELTTDEIYKCLCAKAEVTEILPNGKRVTLNFANYDKPAGYEPIVTPKVTTDIKVIEDTLVPVKEIKEEEFIESIAGYVEELEEVETVPAELTGEISANVTEVVSLEEIKEEVINLEDKVEVHDEVKELLESEKQDSPVKTHSVSSRNNNNYKQNNNNHHNKQKNNNKREKR